jgi:hypothetical protein
MPWQLTNSPLIARWEWSGGQLTASKVQEDRQSARSHRLYYVPRSSRWLSSFQSPICVSEVLDYDDRILQIGGSVVRIVIRSFELLQASCCPAHERFERTAEQLKDFGLKPGQVRPA